MQVLQVTGLGSKVSVSPDWIVVERSDKCEFKDELKYLEYKGEFVYVEELNAIHAESKLVKVHFHYPLMDGYIKMVQKSQ